MTNFIAKNLKQADYDKLKADFDQGDAKIRFDDSTQTIEVDYCYKDFQERQSKLRVALANVFGAQGNYREVLFEKAATPAYKAACQSLLDDSRDALRGHTYRDDPPPNLSGGTAVDQLKSAMGGHDGVCLGGEHSDPKTKQLLIDALNGGADVGLLFIEEFKDIDQPDIDEYMTSGKINNRLKARIAQLDKQHGADFGALLAKAREKNAKVYGIDSGLADSDATPGASALFGERRVAMMNAIAKKIIDDARAANPGKKMIALVGAKHSNTHDGGVPGLAQLFDAPAIKLEGGKLEADPEDKSLRGMPPEEEQHFIEKFIMEATRQGEQLKDVYFDDAEIRARAEESLATVKKLGGGSLASVDPKEIQSEVQSGARNAAEANEESRRKAKEDRESKSQKEAGTLDATLAAEIVDAAAVIAAKKAGDAAPVVDAKTKEKLVDKLSKALAKMPFEKKTSDRRGFVSNLAGKLATDANSGLSPKKKTLLSKPKAGEVSVNVKKARKTWVAELAKL